MPVRKNCILCMCSCRDMASSSSSSSSSSSVVTHYKLFQASCVVVGFGLSGFWGGGVWGERIVELRLVFSLHVLLC
jgi:hypothetical protein